jgi:hypothetical protein
MYVALTYDHRIVDGREAVTFLRRIKELVENPVRMLVEVLPAVAVRPDSARRTGKRRESRNAGLQACRFAGFQPAGVSHSDAVSFCSLHGTIHL